jgi:hypothetical protein
MNFALNSYSKLFKFMGSLNHAEAENCTKNQYLSGLGCANINVAQGGIIHGIRSEIAFEGRFLWNMRVC